MKETYDKGIAFICEGDTERYFYISLLNFFCKKHADCEISELDVLSGPMYFIKHNARRIIIRINTVGTITQIVHSANWFNNTCADRYPSKMPWDVFLCYDTDSHEKDISKFQSGDWKKLRQDLNRRNNIRVIDMAASADIEDVFLSDIESISKFIGVEKTLTIADVPKGRKGKVRLKSLFRQHGKTYHEGARAKDLIEALKKNIIIESNILPLTEIEKSIFEV